MAQLAEMTKPAGGAALAAEELPDLLKRLAEKPPELKGGSDREGHVLGHVAVLLDLRRAAWAASGICGSGGGWCKSRNPNHSQLFQRFQHWCSSTVLPN